MAKDPIADQTLPTQKAAKDVAKLIGCQGAHRVGDAWQPCESPEALKTLITEGAAGYRDWQARQRGKEESQRLHVKRVITNPIIEEEKLRRPKKRVRRKKPKKWEHLGERGVTGITQTGDGLISGQI